MPERYASVLDEPAFSPDALSFFGWYELDKRQWNWIAPESTGFYAFPDLLNTSLSRLLISPSADLYNTWAEEYYDLDFDLKSVTHIFRFLPLAKNTIDILNPDLGLSDIEGDADEIGYPIVDKS
ncbi:hypothetical protein [Deinococcus ruber]|uniref:Uncharacterized protein n=1 Tax=Deinococcus ruber TaxID=1848197 RepID=A0A918CLP7_9DEIO|nr:hypothetical protein [Deinococcus ruber]GGR29526.1 hypothetical protein GCM10008957_45570 [Deinococcus ruber]